MGLLSFYKSFLRTIRQVRIGNMIIIFGLCVTTAAWLAVLYENAEERAEHVKIIKIDNSGLARALEEHVHHAIKTADGILRFIQMEFEEKGAVSETMVDLLQRIKQDPVFNQIAVTNSRGDIILSALPLKRPVNISGREHFETLKRQVSAGLYIARPIVMEATGTSSVFLSRRLRKSDGSFGGIVSVGLNPQYLSELYSSPDIGPDRNIILVGTDGIVRAGLFSGQITLGQDMSSSVLFNELLSKPTGNYEAVSTTIGRDRFISYRKLRDYPLIVVVGQLKTSALAPFSKIKIINFLAVLIFTIFVAGFCAALVGAAKRMRWQHARLLDELDERRRTEAALKISEERFRAIFEYSAVGIAIYGMDRIIRDCNTAFLKMLGFERDEVIGKNISFISHPLDEEFNISLGAMALAEEKGNFSMEKRYVRKDGIYINCLLTVSFVSGSDGNPEYMIAMVVDITERKQMQEALFQSENRYRQLLGAITDSFFVHGLDENGLPGRFIEVNEIACRQLKYSRQELLTMSPADIDAHESDLDRAELTRDLAAGKIRTFELVHIARDGQRIPVEIMARMFNLQGRPVIMSLVRNITNQKRREEEIISYQKQLQRLIQESTLLEERERKRIADELHDTIGQNLFFSKLRLSSLKKAMTGAGDKAAADEIIDLLDQTIQFSRSMTYELGSPVLYTVGLDAGIRWLAEQIQKNQDISIKVDIKMDLAVIEDEMKALLYKTVRELLFNVVKHAHATHIDIIVSQKADALRVEIADNGAGFGQEASTGYGLLSVRERIKYLGGTVKIESGPDAGTRITISVPLPLD